MSKRSNNSGLLVGEYQMQPYWPKTPVMCLSNVKTADHSMFVSGWNTTLGEPYLYSVLSKWGSVCISPSTHSILPDRYGLIGTTSPPCPSTCPEETQRNLCRLVTDDGRPQSFAKLFRSQRSWTWREPPWHHRKPYYDDSTKYEGVMQQRSDEEERNGALIGWDRLKSLSPLADGHFEGTARERERVWLLSLSLIVGTWWMSVWALFVFCWSTTGPSTWVNDIKISYRAHYWL